MNAEFISRPISGQYPEKHFGKITPNCLWVKFVDKDDKEWVGSFEQGCFEQGTFIIKLNKSGRVFIVVGGETYLIDINSKKQLNKSEFSDTKTAILYEQEETIYYSNGFNIRYLDNKGNNFILFDDYYFDDIKLVEIKGAKLYATYLNYQTSNKIFKFEIDLVTKEVKDSFYNIEKKINSNENTKLTLFTKLMKWITK
jgi:hypothetical protein